MIGDRRDHAIRLRLRPSRAQDDFLPVVGNGLTAHDDLCPFYSHCWLVTAQEEEAEPSPTGVDSAAREPDHVAAGEVVDQLTAAEVDGWDSVAHINLMFTIENEFGMQFPGNELAEFKNVGDLKKYLHDHV